MKLIKILGLLEIGSFNLENAIKFLPNTAAAHVLHYLMTSQWYRFYSRPDDNFQPSVAYLLDGFPNQKHYFNLVTQLKILAVSPLSTLCK